MPTIEIDEKVYELVAERAAQNNRTVSEQAEAELWRDHQGRTREEYLRHLDHVLEHPLVLPADAADPVDLIREDRDNR